MRWSNFLSAAFAALLCTSANAAVVQSTYTHVSGASWTAQFVVTNNGDPAPINEFTIYFAESLFSNLSIGASPATWDSVIIQPDTGIPASGFLDALVLDATDALDTGATQAGFVVHFDFLGHAEPGALPFDILDANFVVIFSGRTTLPTAGGMVPEPSTSLLVVLALLGAALSRLPKSGQRRMRVATERDWSAST